MTAKRVSISVPEETYERLAAFRHWVNISAICTYAIEKELDADEEFLGWKTRKEKDAEKDDV